MREEYIGPVGFAREPGEVRKRWIGRILLIILVVFIAWLLFTRVISPPREGGGVPQPPKSELPGPR